MTGEPLNKPLNQKALDRLRRIKMEIEDFVKIEDDQMCKMGNQFWYIARLIFLSKDFEVMEIPLDHLNINFNYEDMTLRAMVMHMKAVRDCNLDYPIIMDEDGDVMDGRHRIMKSILEDKKTIKAVRFKKNPAACRIE
jgi:hypothetical protein